MEKDLLVSVIIVNWNGKQWLSDCLDSLISQNYKNLEIVLVDNNSSDGSVNFVKKKYGEKVEIIKNKENLGFGPSNNIGVKKSKGKILFFLNNDTIIKNHELLKSLVSYKDRENLNIVGPAVNGLDGVNKQGDSYLGIDIFSQPGLSKHFFYVQGCALMIKKTDFIKLGGFDEKYFMYSEDIDLCWRAHLFGMRLNLCKELIILHFGGKSSEKSMHIKGEKHIVPLERRYEVEKNNLRNILKNYKIENLLWVIPFFFLQNFLECLVYIFTGNFKMVAVMVKALFWNLANSRDTFYERKIIQSKRIIGDREILLKMNHFSNNFRAFLEVGMPSFK